MMEIEQSPLGRKWLWHTLAGQWKDEKEFRGKRRKHKNGDTSSPPPFGNVRKQISTPYPGEINMGLAYKVGSQSGYKTAVLNENNFACDFYVWIVCLKYRAKWFKYYDSGKLARKGDLLVGLDFLFPFWMNIRNCAYSSRNLNSVHDVFFKTPVLILVTSMNSRLPHTAFATSQVYRPYSALCTTM